MSDNSELMRLLKATGSRYYPGVRRCGSFDDAALERPRDALPPAGCTFTFCELFAGIGGFRLGLEPLGGRCVFASEICPAAQRTYTANFGSADAPLCGDLLDEYAQAMPPFDVLTAGFPCQPFSQRGEQHGLDDRRGALYLELARVLKVCQPKAFVFENVPQLVLLDGGWRPIDHEGCESHDGARAGGQLAKMLATFEALGYRVSWRLLNARRWVAQKRLRLYMVGIRADLPGADSFAFPSDAVPADGSAPTVRACLEPAWATEPEVERCSLTQQQWDRVASAAFCAKSNRSVRSREIAIDGAAPTLISGYRRTISLTTKYVFEEADGTRRTLPRFLTKRECASLMGFDSSFVLPSPRQATSEEAYRQLGNAVVPPVIRAIVEVEAWVALASLRELNLSHNLLKALPTALQHASGLRVLNVRSNQLLAGCGTDQLRGWQEQCAWALQGLTQLHHVDLRYNPRVSCLPLTMIREALPPHAVVNNHVDSDGSSGSGGGGCTVLLGAEEGVPIRRGSALTKAVPGDGLTPTGWPTLLAQLTPLSTPAVLQRLHDVFSIGSGVPEVDYQEVGSSRDTLLHRLAEAYVRRAQPSTGGLRCGREVVVDSARCRREVTCDGVAMPEALCSRMLEALRAARWPSQTDRPKVGATGYIVLERPPTDAPTETATSARRRRANAKRERHAALWEVVASWMDLVDASFEYTGVALSKGFRGSPHVDTYDISYQWAISLGDFEGGELCVESGPCAVTLVNTRGRAAKVDGRYPHWVAPWCGERYSVIVYKTAGTPTPKGPAVYVQV